MAMSEKNLKQYLSQAEADLNRGEKVRVDFDNQAHSMWLDFQMSGYYPDMMCIKEQGSYWLARIR